MPLNIHIKKGQQVIINGAVLENAGARPARGLEASAR